MLVNGKQTQKSMQHFWVGRYFFQFSPLIFFLLLSFPSFSLLPPFLVLFRQRQLDLTGTKHQGRVVSDRHGTRASWGHIQAGIANVFHLTAQCISLHKYVGKAQPNWGSLPSLEGGAKSLVFLLLSC